MMFFVERDIAIDMGTNNTLLYVSGKGIRLREPTIVAVDRQTGQISGVGESARKAMGRTPANLVVVHPISAGVISDYDMTAAMLRDLIRRVTNFSLFEPRVLVCVPGGISGVEERAIMDAVIEAGRGHGGWGRSGREPGRRTHDHRHRRRYHGGRGGLSQRRGGLRVHQDRRHCL